MASCDSIYDSPLMTYSLLSDLPNVCKHELSGEVLVLWRGIIMPYVVAMYRVLRVDNVYPTLLIGEHIEQQYQRLIMLGVIKPTHPPAHRLRIASDASRPPAIEPTQPDREILSHTMVVFDPIVQRLRAKYTTAELCAMMDPDMADLC